ncbi:conserved hypothetical protein [Methanococcus vannielii SB]|uniref:Uncharacterized protein n=1 Tax=Methanococcus vannielii (strain ATCC 35089 / DSM 1224 / JCM 13029 / OCM 148 / SB) TaxID=406327 RepID=A6USS0_METVS|nr:hypothetical protein [Methanococcus vannielii]ABR55542.1 conserved hypothetical protein [Methanococcus vannielii SB]
MKFQYLIYKGEIPESYGVKQSKREIENLSRFLKDEGYELRLVRRDEYQIAKRKIDSKTVKRRQKFYKTIRHDYLTT